MSETLTIRLPDDLAAWVEERARITGIAKSRLIREELERARSESLQPKMADFVGCIEGDPDLSQRKGFSGGAGLE